MKRKGYFLAIEGIDGMGKSTLLGVLEEFLTSKGLTVKRTREPTDSLYGREIREIARKGRDGISPEYELNLFIQDRALDVATNIQPALEAGHVIMTDRYFYSNIAYQGSLGLDPEQIRSANEARFPIPDLVLLLDAPPSVGIARIRGGRGEENNQGYEQEAFLEQVRARFLAMKDPNIVRLDATKDRAELEANVQALLTERLGDRFNVTTPRP